VGFVVEEVKLGQIYFTDFTFNNIPLILHFSIDSFLDLLTDSFIPLSKIEAQETQLLRASLNNKFFSVLLQMTASEV